MKRCPKCGNDFKAKEGGYCKTCRAEYARNKHHTVIPGAENRFIKSQLGAAELLAKFGEIVIPTPTSLIWRDNYAASLMCGCCTRSDLPLGEAITGVMLCDFCALYSATCGRCLEHNGPIVDPSRLGASPPILSMAQRDEMYPPLVCVKQKPPADASDFEDLAQN